MDRFNFIKKRSPKNVNQLARNDFLPGENTRQPGSLSSHIPHRNYIMQYERYEDADTLGIQTACQLHPQGQRIDKRRSVAMPKIPQDIIEFLEEPQAIISSSEYSPELQRVLAPHNMYLLKEWSHLEQKMCYESSATGCTMSWRGGVAKTSFTYLLLDPRITRNLPAATATSNLRLWDASDMGYQIWDTFLQAIFYVGKRKWSSCYSYLHQPLAVWEKRHSENHFSKKVERILEIFHSGHGVVCLYVFCHIIPVEACTREAAMISALTVGRLTNEKSGNFFGPSAKWSLHQKQQLGAVLLYRACQVFMGEGERQIMPADVDKHVSFCKRV